jgi:hypothetical protein
MNSDHFVFFISLRDEIDFVHHLNFVFIIWFIWDSASNYFLFVISFTFSFVFVQLFFIYQLSFRSLRNHYFRLFLFIDDHDTMIVKWSSTKKKRLLKKETSIKLCCVACASLNRKRIKIAKILRTKIEFRAKKRELDFVFKRFEARFVRFSVYDLFCQSSSKWNDVVFIEKNERRNWDCQMRAFELI